jgi:small ligand-binding sensory domain FIST
MSMRWSSAAAEGADLAVAAASAVTQTAAGLDGRSADLVVAFLSSEYASSEASLVTAAIEARWPGATILGCTAGGIVGGGRELEQTRAVSITAASLPGVTLTPFHLAESELAAAAASPWSLRKSIPVGEEEAPAFVLLPDPFSTDTERLLTAIDACWTGAPVIGGLSSGALRPGDGVLLGAGTTHSSGTVGLALTGNVRIETVVAQGCRPVGRPMVVTACHDNLLIELNGMPAGQALTMLFATLEPEDQRLVRYALQIGLVIDEERQPFQQGDFLIRNLLGMDPRRGVIAIGERLTEHQIIQFHVRDADASRKDLDAVLERWKAETEAPSPAGALLFSCLGRGEKLYGEPNHDSEVFARHVGGDIPLGGFFGNGEIGPVHGSAFLHGYTSSFGLFSSRES